MAAVEIEGWDRLIARLVKLQESLDEVAEKAIREVAEKVRDTAKELCPVDTGSLQKSIRLQTAARQAGHIHSIGVSAGGYITNPKTGRKVDYARHVEYGTSRGPPQAYLQPAIILHAGELVKALKKGIAESRGG